MSNRTTAVLVPPQVRTASPAAVAAGPSPVSLSAHVDVAARALAGEALWDQHSEPVRQSYRRDAARALAAVEEALRADAARG